MVNSKVRVRGSAPHARRPAAMARSTESSDQSQHDLALGLHGVETALDTTATVRPMADQSGHIVGPTQARDAQMLEQYISPGGNDSNVVSHVRPNPYSVYSDDPRNPVVYLKVPRQRSLTTSGNGSSGFKQCETIEKILEPLGPNLFEL